MAAAAAEYSRRAPGYMQRVVKLLCLKPVFFKSLKRSFLFNKHLLQYIDVAVRRTM